jgi:ATP/maltotriose-dependent transcriptional regulator MalT/two-component SAPR family response regulator
MVADFVRNQERKFVWYQLDHTDADPFIFLGYITEGISQIEPGFGQVMKSYLAQSADDLAREPERAVDILLNEVLDNVDHQFILVLDDYHHLGEVPAVHAIADRLLQYVPDVMHVIIISRDAPPLALARLRSHSSLAIIDRTELLFTDEETRELFRKVFDIELTPEQLSEYRERTHGWITALQLVRQVAQRQALARPSGEGVAPDLTEILRQSERDIFDYFAEEVFADEAPDVKKFLTRISLLDSIEIETCSAIFSEFDCRTMLPALVRRNVFITLASDGRGEEYRLHPLFQAFLRKRLRADEGRYGVAAENRRCADYFLNNGLLDQAMRHFLEAEEFEIAAALIAGHGADWIQPGALVSLDAYIAALPSEMLERHPRSLFYQAEVVRIRGDLNRAQALFRQAASLLNQAGDAEGEAEAQHSLATIARRKGDCATAFDHVARALALAAERSIVRVKCGNTSGLCLMATGDLETAEREFRLALQSAEELGDDHYVRLIAHNLGLPAGMRGDFGEALRWSRRMLSDGASAAPFPQEATAHLNIARFNLYLGQLGPCEEHLEKALEGCRVFNLTSLQGEIFEAFGSLYRERGDFAKSGEYFERASRAYNEVGTPIERTELVEEQALLALELGDVARARSMVDRLVAERVSSKDLSRLYTSLLTRARIMLSQQAFDTVRQELIHPLAYFREHHLYYYEAQAALALSVAELALRDDVSMLAHLRRALDLAARYDYDYWLKREVSRHPELLAIPDAAELLPADVKEQQAVRAPLRQPASVATLAAPLTDLTMNMLGPIEIYRDPARPLSTEAWTTRRAKDILCFIGSRPHRRASKDTIIDTFWADADFDVIEKNFHPTVSHIRKALNSNQAIRQNFLLYRDGDYQLNSEFSYRIDTEEFDRLVGVAEAARRAAEHDEFVTAAERAVALYRGDFMQGSYDEWVDDQRGYYRERYLGLLDSLSGAAQEQGDWTRSLQLAQKILREDQFREDVHCKIMRAQAALGNRAAVKEQFEHLRKVLRDELGIEPAAETRRIYAGLMK